MMETNHLRYGVGVDMSKNQFHSTLSILLENGHVKIKKTKKFKNSKEGFQSFVDWLNKGIKDKNLSVRILMEVTGVYHENLLYYLHDLGYEVVLEQGKRVKKYSQAMGYESKTDKLDSRAIAEMACKDFGRIWEPASPHILEIQTVLRLRKTLIKNKVRLNNQLHARQHGKHKFGQVTRTLNNLIEVTEKELEKLEEEVMKLAEKDEELFAKVEMISDSVKGLGALSVLTIVAETNGFHDFTSSKQLVSYAGYDIVENQSGKFVGKTKISKNGNANIRATLYMNSMNVIRWKLKPYYEFYLRLIKRNGGIKKKAMVAVQRKLLVLIYTLWKKNEPFIENYHQKMNNIELVKV